MGGIDAVLELLQVEVLTRLVVAAGRDGDVGGEVVLRGGSRSKLGARTLVWMEP